MKAAIVLVLLLAGGYGIWQYREGIIGRSETKLARVVELDPRKVDAPTRALLLLETIPELREAERTVAVQRLRSTLEAIPRGLVLHKPPFPIEEIRFSDNGTAVMWYGETTGGPRVEIWSRRASQIQSWVPKGSYATFLNETGTEMYSMEGYDVAPDGVMVPSKSKMVMSRDGGYYARVADGILSIWSVHDLAAEKGLDHVSFRGTVPHATTRLHCVRAGDVCGVERRDGFTIVDLRKDRILRSIAAERHAVMHMSPSGRLVGVAGPRAGLTIHAVREGREVDVDAAGVEDFAFSGDEKRVVVLDRDGVLHSYDAASGRRQGQSTVLRGEPWAHIDTAGEGRFVVWGGEKVRLLGGDLATVAARFDEGGDVAIVKANRQGDRLAIARSSGVIALWDVSAKIPASVADDELVDSACAHIGRSLTRQEWATWFPNERYYARCR